MKKLAWLILLITSFAAGQTVTVTASHLQNASGQLISGYIYLQPTLTSGQPTWYRAPGGGTVSSAAVPVPVVNGVLSVTLPDTTLTYPANLCFTMTYPQGSLATGYNCLQPHTTAYNSSDWCQSGVCNLDNYLPGNQPLPTINAVSSINYTAGNLTFTGSGFSQSGDTFTFNGGSVQSLTTTGTSGASTLSGGILNVPQYQAALGYTPAHSGANSDITSLTGLTTPLSVLQGGTGQNSLVPTTPVTTTPSGSCAQGAPNQQDTVTGIQYSCQNVVGGVGTWGAVGALCGSGSGTGTMCDGAGTTTAGYFPLSTITAHTYSIDTNLDDGHSTANTLTYLGSGGIAASTGPIIAQSAQFGSLGTPTLLNVTGQLISSLPGTGNVTGDYRLVTDGTTQADCSTGGGTTQHWCYWTGSAWTSAAPSALADPGANGIIKRTALNTTAPAVAGTDYVGEIASGTATLGTTAISANSCATAVTATATGVATTDVIMADFNSDPSAITGYGPSGGGLTVYKWPSANQVNFKVCNPTSASITPGAATLNWRVVR